MFSKRESCVSAEPEVERRQEVKRREAPRAPQRPARNSIIARCLPSLSSRLCSDLTPPSPSLGINKGRHQPVRPPICPSVHPSADPVLLLQSPQMGVARPGGLLLLIETPRSGQVTESACACVSAGVPQLMAPVCLCGHRVVRQPV